MICPKCGKDTEVRDSRWSKGGPQASLMRQYVRRRRYCACGNRFTTVEVEWDEVVAMQKREAAHRKLLTKLLDVRLLQDLHEMGALSGKPAA